MCISKNNIEFGKKLTDPPLVFYVNYFLKSGEGKYLNTMDDKRVWIKWMELRRHGDVEAIKTPTGYIPKYPDLKKLFKEVLSKDYSEKEYEEQFAVRLGMLLAKIDRIEKIYRPIPLSCLQSSLQSWRRSARGSRRPRRNMEKVFHLSRWRKIRSNLRG